MNQSFVDYGLLEEHIRECEASHQEAMEQGGLGITHRGTKAGVAAISTRNTIFSQLQK